MKTRLFVRLLVPDTTAITAKRTLERLGFPIEYVRRYEYYEIEADEEIYDLAKTCDLLVNANKHICMREPEKGGTSVLVIEGEDENLGRSLEHYGLPIRTVKTGVVWTLGTGEETAKRAAKELLYNEHYQRYEIL